MKISHGTWTALIGKGGVPVVRRLIVWGLFLPFGLYVPLWWALVFTGYYDETMSPEMVTRTKLLLPPDLFLTLLLASMIHGLRRRKLWGYVCGFLMCGGMIYITIQGGLAILIGNRPGDLATQLIIWPYLAMGALGALMLYRDLRSRLAGGQLQMR